MNSLGKSLQRSKRANARQGRKEYQGMLEAERDAAIDAAAAREKNKTNTLKSIWETNDLENFLSIADAREEGYYAERDVRVVIGGNVHVVRNDKVVPQAEDTKKDWLKLSELLTIPRRPQWEYSMTPDEVQAGERSAFVDWRRSLAMMEEEHQVIMTPYERNLEVWRQLWRVVERADVVVMILDARNPLIFRSKDFDKFVASTRDRTGAGKKLILLLNKADLLTEAQRKEWAAYFQSQDDLFFFFSAMPLTPLSDGAEKSSDSDDEEDEERLDAETVKLTKEQEKAAMEKLMKNKKEKSRHKKKSLRAPVEVANPYELAAQRRAAREAANAPKVKEVKPLTEEEKARNARVAATSAVPIEPWTLLDPIQLLDQFALLRGEAGVTDENTPLMVGLVGYPNVGKSSTINAIIGAKKVVVSATPGKTKHFQTLKIPNERRVELCDCPGLVFPSFASTTAQMVCDGILPVDTLTESVGAAAVMCRRLPRQLLEVALNVSLLAEDDVEQCPSLAERLLSAVARRRGYMASHDRANKARAGKDLLKLYVEGRFVFVEPPPSYQLDENARSLQKYLADRGVTSESGVPGAAAGTTTGATGNVIVGEDGEEYEEWDSEQDEAWAALADAEEERALSEYGDEYEDDRDSLYEEVAAPMFFARPHGMRSHFTRAELFNLEANEARMAERKPEKRRRRRVNHQLEPDMYTFVNRQGEVELRIDDDDGVVELVTASGAPVRPKLGPAGPKQLTKKQMRRQMKKDGAAVPTNPTARRVGVQDY